MHGAKKGLFRSPALRRKQKRASFGVLRYARSKKGRLSESCVTHGAKKGVFRSPALRTEQKRVSFGALRYARSKKSMASLGLCLCDRFVGTFPQRKQQRTDAFAFLLRADKFVLGHARIRRMQSSSLMIRSHWSTAYPPRLVRTQMGTAHPPLSIPKIVGRSAC